MLCTLRTRDLRVARVKFFYCTEEPILPFLLLNHYDVYIYRAELMDSKVYSFPRNVILKLIPRRRENVRLKRLLRKMGSIHPSQQQSLSQRRADLTR